MLRYPKRQRLPPRSGGDRITLDVGGTRFVVAASTLSTSSSFFSTLLSNRWTSPSDGDSNLFHDDTIFLDQDPAPFAKLLSYMRLGSIKVDDVDERVLILADFLVMERFLLAAKARWYVNIGRGPVLLDEDEMAREFDRKFGGIRRAISTGLFPAFLHRDEVDAEREEAVLIERNFNPDDVSLDNRIWVKEAGKADEVMAGGVVGALNKLNVMGYTKHEEHFERPNAVEGYVTFSRLKHKLTIGGNAMETFIPRKEEINDLREFCTFKQIALQLEDRTEGSYVVVAPAGVAGNRAGDERRDDEGSDPFAVVTHIYQGSWLKDHGFLTKEEGYERLFKDQLRELAMHYLPEGGEFTEAQLFSRRVAQTTSSS